jgi:predicted metal-dependent peptidase
MPRVPADTDTMATDGETLFYSPSFADSLTQPEIDFVLVHEVFHKWFLHHTRREGRDPQLWNVAADYVINLAITQDFPTLTPPKGVLLSPLYKGMSTEQVYDMLVQQGQGQGQGQGAPSTDPSTGQGWGEVRDCPNPSGEESRVKAEIAQGIASCKPGSIPGTIKKLFDDLMAPAKVPWQEVLRDFMNSCKPTDYTWRRPNRRHLPDYLPSLSEPGLGHVVVAIDTSGSCLSELPVFLSELKKIFADCKPGKITVILCDYRVSATYASLDEIPPELTDIGGGTRFSPVFDAIEDRPDCLVYFTDGYGDVPSEPDYPVVWAITPDGHNSIPWGMEVDL